MRPSRWLLILLSLFAGFSFVSCLSPRKHVAEQLQKIKYQWQTNLTRQATLPERVLDWPTAVSLLETNNLKLRQARDDVLNSREDVRQVFRDLIPALNLQATLTKRLTDLANVSVSDVNFNADAFFNVPGFISFGARLYATKLYELRAEAAYELARREQIVALYKLFIGARSTQQAKEHLENQVRTAGAMANVDPFSAQLMATELEGKELAQEKDEESLQQQTVDLIGNYNYRWVFLTNGLPELRYDLRPLPLADANRVAQTQMKLFAIELEAARAQLLGIKLRYWPELNIFVTGPPVFQSAFGRTTFWSANEIEGSANVYWFVDTRGYISRQLRQTKRQQEIQKIRYTQEAVSLMDRLLFTQSALTNTVRQLKQVNLHLAILQAVPPAQNYASIQKYADDYRNLVDQQQKLERDLADLQTLFWFVDENAWTNSALARAAPLAPPRAAESNRREFAHEKG